MVPSGWNECPKLSPQSERDSQVLESNEERLSNPVRLPPGLRVHHLPILRQHQRLHVSRLSFILSIVQLIETILGNVTLATSTSTHFALWGEDRSRNSGLRGWVIGQLGSR